jgi:hypothetical protein
MRFEVPQFIEIEDKIFGPLTWRQFLYLGGGVGMGVVLFLTTSFVVFLFIGLPLAVLAGALAFYPVNNRPFSYFLEAIVTYLKGTKLYIWKQKDQTVYRGSFAPGTSQLPKTAAVVNTPAISQRVPLARRLELEALQKTE